jgi:hypothetical protein
VYEEAAEALAERTIKEARPQRGQSTLEARIQFESRLVLSRDATTQELATLHELFDKIVAPESPLLKNASLRLSVKPPQDFENSTRELDGLKALGSVLLNLDAAMNR